MQSAAFAASTDGSCLDPQVQDIPQRPTAPRQLAPKKPVDLFHCERSFIYRKKTYELDSNTRQDAENLRPYFLNIPPALAELDTYQTNRLKLRNMAYLGTLGFLIMVVGGIGSGRIHNPDLASTIGTLSFWGGLGTTAFSIGYSGVSIVQNEKHLRNGIQLYNDAHPNDPIELKVSAGVSLKDILNIFGL